MGRPPLPWPTPWTVGRATSNREAKARLITESYAVVRFASAGLQCAADLFLPGGLDGRAPAIVIGRGFGGVRESNRREAGRLREAGYAVLSIDYRAFGDSQGEPRGQAFPLEHAEDFRNAISYLETRPEVDAARIGLWGTSFAGSVVLYTAAVDRRVGAVVAQLPTVNGRAWLRSLRTAGQWEELLAALEADRRQRFAGAAGARVPLSGPIGSLCAMPTADPEQAEHMARLKRVFPTWRDDLVLESLERVIEFEPAAFLGRIAPRAACIVTAAGRDLVHPVDQILDAYASLREPRQLVLMPYEGLDLRFDPGWTKALDHAIAWFDRHLKRHGSPAGTEPA